jgi:hypothetical protein
MPSRQLCRSRATNGTDVPCAPDDRAAARLSVRRRTWPGPSAYARPVMRWAAVRGGRGHATGLVAGALLVAAVASGCGPAGAARPSAAPTRSGGSTATPEAGDTPGPVAAAPSGRPYCGASADIEEITLKKWPNGDFQVSLRPTDAGRHADDRDAATATMWQAIVNCVHPPSGGIHLDGTVGASLFDQLRCHEYFALVPSLTGGAGYATGPTYDIESWRPVAGEARWISSECGNKLGTDPTGAQPVPYRPDGVRPQYSSSGEDG